MHRSRRRMHRSRGLPWRPGSCKRDRAPANETAVICPKCTNALEEITNRGLPAMGERRRKRRRRR